MKTVFLFFALALSIFSDVSGQHYRKNGSPDRRYKENKTSYTSPSGTSAHTRSSRTFAPAKIRTARSTYPRERDQRGRFVRSSSATNKFKKQTGYPHGRHGYVIDHIVPLKKGGCDCPSNMQWQTIPDAKAKDKWEMP